MNFLMDFGWLNIFLDGNAALAVQISSKKSFSGSVRFVLCVDLFCFGGLMVPTSIAPSTRK